MHCYECSQDTVERAAVASCGACGAGVCADHATAHPAPRPAPRIVGVIPTPPSRPASRSFLCLACDEAQPAARPLALAR